MILMLFLYEMVWDRPRKRKKNFSPEFCSYPTRARKFQKNSKKFKKIRKHNSGIISIQNGLREAKKEKKKNFSHKFRSYPSRASISEKSS